WDGFDLESGSYVRVIGKIVQPAGGGRRDADADSDDPPPKNYLKLDRLRLVADRHEIFYHILEVLKFTKMRRTGTILTNFRGNNAGGVPVVEAAGSDEKKVKPPNFMEIFTWGATAHPPLLRERVSNTSKASTLSSTQSNQPSSPQVPRELEARTTKAPQRTLS
ncbi:hypothetical protein SCHPADRAFT_897592, partial [Schizopora paradoxa]